MLILSQRCVLVVSTILLLGVTATPGLAPPPAARVIRISGTGFFSEPSVAIDPQHPAHAVAAYQTNENVAYTRDGGRTWHVGRAAGKGYRLNGGDVSVAYDAKGRVDLCYISFDRLGSEQYWAHGAVRNGIFVTRSPDGGAHWESHQVAVVKQPPGHGIFEDKPYIIADVTHGPYRGNLYVGWTEFHLGYSEMHFSRSTDGGTTWSSPTRISTQNGSPRDDNGVVEGFHAVVAPDGTLNVVWGGGEHVFFTSSHDGGKTFSPSRAILDLPASYYTPNGFSGRGGNGFPQMGIDPASKRLVIDWSDYRNGEIDVFTATSSDNGATWSAPVKVNDDPIHDGRDHFFNWLTVDPTNGDVYVVFADRRRDPKNVRFTMTLARSTDGGARYRNYAWSTELNDPSPEFMGDYSGLAAYGGTVYGAWTQSVAHTKDTPHPGRRAAHTAVYLGIARFK